MAGAAATSTSSTPPARSSSSTAWSPPTSTRSSPGSSSRTSTSRCRSLSCRTCRRSRPLLAGRRQPAPARPRPKTVTAIEGPLGVECYHYVWSGGERITATMHLLQSANGRLPHIGERLTLGPYAVLVVDYDFLSDTATLVRFGPRGWADFLATRPGRLIITAAVWGLADVDPHRQPTWQCVHALRWAAEGARPPQRSAYVTPAATILATGDRLGVGGSLHGAPRFAASPRDPAPGPNHPPAMSMSLYRRGFPHRIRTPWTQQITVTSSAGEVPVRLRSPRGCTSAPGYGIRTGQTGAGRGWLVGPGGCTAAGCHLQVSVRSALCCIRTASDERSPHPHQRAGGHRRRDTAAVRRAPRLPAGRARVPGRYRQAGSRPQRSRYPPPGAGRPAPSAQGVTR